MENDLVVKSNALVEAAYSLTLTEQKVILSAITQVRRDEPITDEVLYSISANALADMGGFAATHEYQMLKEASERLWERTLVVYEKPNGGGSRKSKIRWVQRADYIDDEGRVELRFSKDILPYLTTLQSQFTKYRLQYVALMKSRYGIRLYELLIQWRSTGERELEIGWLREVWSLTDKYKAIKDFKKYVIEPAVADINKCSDLWCKWGQRKTGRKVTHIQFQFGQKPGIKKLDTKKRMTEKEFHQFCQTKRGESLQQAVARAKEEGFILGFNPFAKANKKVTGQAKET